MKRRNHLLVTTAVTALAVTGLTAPAMTSAQGSQAPSADPKAAAMASADRLIAGNAADLHTGKDEKYIRTQVVGTPWDQYYVAYERTYHGLPVVGGDFVIATDGQGRVRTLSVAQKQQITVATTPKVSEASAAGRSRSALTKPDDAQVKPRLVVHALAKPRLAWETTVAGRDGKQPSRKKVYVDAQTGKRFDTQETIHAGTGTGIWEGPNLTIGTTQSGSTYTMRDPNRPGMTCADYSGNRIFSGPDDVWGSTSKTSKEAGCVDVMYAGAGFWDLLKSFGRTGLRNGQWAPARVGLNAVNAYWNGTDAQFGHNQSNQWITSTDVVDHEFGHGLDNFTPGGMSGGGTQEFVGDVWGAAVEAFLNNPQDTPDYTVGEEVNLVGRGPIRNMYNPSQVNNDPNCYSSSVPRMEVHKAAGPGNHWFYLLAEGSNPGGGKPNSPVCQGGQVTGIGVMNAAKIFYNAMMLKTSGTSYPRYRVLTLTAAKNLDPTCASYNKVKAAWDAVQLGAQSGEPTCTAGVNDSAAYTVGGGLPKVVAAPDINVENVKAHLQQFQTIARSNGGNRRSTGGGYLGSVSYIEQKLKAAGFTVTRQACSSGCTAGAGPNLIADWPGGNENNVYMFGAHLDSVAAGAGINDNGTGSAALLETALQLAQSNPSMLNHIRLGWWTDEEQGLRGSKFYTSRLPAAERSKIKGYFNFDMVGSPNPGYFIDYLNSPLSANLKGYFDSIQVPTEEVQECCSDDGSFRAIGVPTSTLSTGAGARKSAAQAQKWGGTAGQAYDRCYHQACDSYPGNVNTTALDRSADAMAWALWKVAVGGAGAPDAGAVQPLAVPLASTVPKNAPDVNVENVKGHLQQLQTIATSNGGTRRSTGAGYLGSVSYIEQKLKAAGFTVSRQACSSGCSGGAGPNLIADWPGGNENNVYMFGAHLDSVAAGPGINDNGTGSAAQLEVALQLAQSKPTMLNHVRFGWWTDEEQGLRGSRYYVSRLSATDRSKIKGYFNFDMVGSPNAGYFIDDINSPLAKNLKEYFDSINVPTEEVAECCSDDGSFRNAGIATTFLFTGAPATKTAAQARKWGGTAGQPFDRCYHQSCDRYPSNVDMTALDRCSDAIAHALWKVAVGAQPASGDGRRL